MYARHKNHTIGITITIVRINFGQSQSITIFPVFCPMNRLHFDFHVESKMICKYFEAKYVSYI